MMIVQWEVLVFKTIRQPLT